jgi:hypothetical protein
VFEKRKDFITKHKGLFRTGEFYKIEIARKEKREKISYFKARKIPYAHATLLWNTHHTLKRQEESEKRRNTMASFAGFSGGIKGTKKKRKINVQEEEEGEDKNEKREAVLAVGKNQMHLKEEREKVEEKKLIPAMRNTFEVGTGRQRKVRACCAVVLYFFLQMHISLYISRLSFRLFVRSFVLNSRGIFALQLTSSLCNNDITTGAEFSSNRKRENGR